MKIGADGSVKDVRGTPRIGVEAPGLASHDLERRTHLEKSVSSTPRTQVPFVTTRQPAEHHDAVDHDPLGDKDSPATNSGSDVLSTIV